MTWVLYSPPPPPTPVYPLSYPPPKLCCQHTDITSGKCSCSDVATLRSWCMTQVKYVVFKVLLCLLVLLLLEKTEKKKKKKREQMHTDSVLYHTYSSLTGCLPIYTIWFHTHKKQTLLLLFAEWKSTSMPEHVCFSQFWQLTPTLNGGVSYNLPKILRLGRLKGSWATTDAPTPQEKSKNG